MPRKKKVQKNSYVAQKKIKEENRHKILTTLLKSPSTFSELLRETGLSPMGLTKHLHELEELEQIELIIHERKRAYTITGKTPVEDLILEELMKKVGSFITYKILQASSRGEKEVHIEEFYAPQGFVNQFIEKTFNLTDIDHEALFKAYTNRYGEPKI